MQQITAAHPNPVTEPGTAQSRDHGRYRLDLSLPVDGGFTINTYPKTGVDRIDALCFTVADVDTANLIYRVIREGGEQGVSPDGIRQALTDALTRDLHEVQRRHDLPSQNRVEHINRLLDRLESPADTARVAELAEHVRRNLADTVPAGRHPQVTRSRSNVERQPLSATQQRIVNTHRGGIIRTGKGVSWLSLQSIARKGYAEVVTRSGQKVTAIRLNKQGLNAVKAVA